MYISAGKVADITALKLPDGISHSSLLSQTELDPDIYIQHRKMPRCLADENKVHLSIPDITENIRMFFFL